MFNSGNNKGPMGWLGSAQKVVYKDREVEKIVKVDRLIDGHTIDYWHNLSIEMEKLAAARFDSGKELLMIAAERSANNAGLSAVILYLLAELKKIQPNNPLLDKHNRDRIFDKFHQEQMSKELELTGLKMWNPLRRPNEKKTP